MEIVSRFKPQLFVNSIISNTNIELKNFAIKIVLRKCCSMENLGKIKEASFEIEKAIVLDMNHSEVKLTKQRIQVISLILNY